MVEKTCFYPGSVLSSDWMSDFMFDVARMENSEISCETTASVSDAGINHGARLGIDVTA